MARPEASLLALIGCAEPWFDAELEPLEPELDVIYTASQLWDLVGLEGTVVTVSPLIVTTPRTLDGTAFYASDPKGGPRTGVRIQLDATIFDWPPPVGTRIQATGNLVNAGIAPILEVVYDIDIREVGIVGIPPIRRYAPASGFEHSVVSVPNVTVTSRADPLGHADLNGVSGLAALFGPGPGWNRTGTLVGLLDGGRVSPRFRTDWSGEVPGDPPVVTDLAGLDALDDGTPVTLDDLVLATPWSRDGRWAVVQDPTGAGRWVDAEGWGLSEVVARGEVGSWTAEVRHDDDGLYLRVWDPPTVTGVRDPIVGELLADGAISEILVTGIGPADAYGERRTDGPTLDDRFVTLDDLPDPSTVIGAVRASPGPQRLAPLDPL